MTDNPCNCSNCPHAQNLGDDETPAMYCTEASKHNYIMECDYEDTQLRGCMWHPGAREWLMRDVVKELEQIDLLVPYPQYPHLDLSESLAYIPALNCVRIHEIIALIRGGK